MSKLIVLRTKNPNLVLSKFLPALNNRLTGLKAPNEFNPLTLHVQASDECDLVDKLRRIKGNNLVIVRIEYDLEYHKAENGINLTPLSVARHMSEQLDKLRLSDFKFNVLLVSDKLTERAQFIADMYWEEVADQPGVYNNPRCSNTYTSRFMGNELSQRVKESLTRITAGIDRDGDRCFFGYVQQDAAIYPKGIHPYLAIGWHLPEYPEFTKEVHKEKSIPRDQIRRLHANEDRAYEELLIESFITHPKAMMSIYGDMPDTFNIMRGLTKIQTDLLNAIVEPILEGIQTMSDEALIGVPNIEQQHPYVIWCIAKVLRPTQKLMINDRELCKEAVNMLTRYSPLWCQNRLDAFVATLADHIKPLFEDVRY